MTEMSTKLMVVLAVAVALSCRRDTQLGRPELAGPAVGEVSDAVTFTASVTEPHDNDVAYEFAWGDTSHLEWTPYYPSGQPVARTHAYADTGIYSVRVKAMNSQEIESEWSDIRRIAIGLAPSRPSLAARRYWLVDQPCSVTVCSNDPSGRRLTYGILWDDGSPLQWSDSASSGTPMTLVHTYLRTDTHYLVVKAQNSRGLTSDWSDSLELRLQQSITCEVTLDITGSTGAFFNGYYETTTEGRTQISGTVPEWYTFSAHVGFDIVAAQMTRIGSGQIVAKLVADGVTRDSAATSDIIDTIVLEWVPE